MVAFDSSTLGKVSRDYWSDQKACRDRARTFLDQLTDRGVYIALTLTHVSELLRHGNNDVVQERIRFLRNIRLIAWLRPYKRTWFPGGIPDLLMRELHAVVHCSARGWRGIIQCVRPDLWETGTGADMFVEDPVLWSAIRRECERQHQHEQLIASIARTDAGGINDVKLRDAVNSPRRPKEERANYARGLHAEMKRQLDRHGDRRLENAGNVAKNFCQDTLERVAKIDELGDDPFQSILRLHGVPSELIGPKTTIGEIGEIAIYVRRLALLSDRLTPTAKLTISAVPPDVLPSHVLERGLASLQGKASRVSGSDLGDSNLAPLAFYTDAVEVDKRMLGYLTQLQQGDARMTGLMGRPFRSSDYAQIPMQFGA